MRAVIVTVALATAAGLALLWAQGGLEGLARWALDVQREAQNAMAGALRRLRAGEAGALAGLIGLAFAYGVAHAAGPGHGKVLIGGYGAATGVGLGRLAAVSLAAALAQATTAVALVAAGIALLGLSRAQLTSAADETLAPVAALAIAAIGVWLALRGALGLWRLRPAATGAPALATAGAHARAHTHGSDCGCGHRHGPAPHEVAGLRGWRDAALLVGAIAIRPCTGALFLLIITWHMGLLAAGIAGVYAMALGTALVTVAVAALSVLARDGALMWGDRLGRAAALRPALELAAGVTVALVAGQMALMAR